ncbi:MAG TPA: autotransporter-associated beta strand repeat-containing protein, partial [Rhodanobacter sp.]
MGGTGGNGGAGISGSSFTVSNSGGIRGGTGGAGGDTSGYAGFGGNNGVAVISTGSSSITTSGSIAGGAGVSSQADAVDFSGGGNTLTLENGYQFVGNVVSISGIGSNATNGGDTLTLGGGVSATAPFDVSRVVDTLPSGTAGTQYVGFNQFSKTGSSVWILTGSTTAVGTWDVKEGVLVVGATGDTGASVAGGATVASGATLGGHGTLGGDVDIANGAHLAPGNSIGTLSIGGNLTVAQGSVLDFEFGAPAGAPGTFTSFGSGDSVRVGGNLALNGALLNISNAGGFGPGLYNLFTYGGTLTETNGGIGFGTVPAGNYTLQNLTASKQINLLNTTGLTLNLWNGNGLANATRMGGGDGSWTTTSPNWTDATGSLTTAMQPQPGFAIFGDAAGTVTVNDDAGNVSATGLQFASNSYTLTGDTLTLVDAGGTAPVIRVGDGSAAGAGYTATIHNVLAGTDGLTKADLGTLVLTAANTYSGGTVINGGTLEIATGGAPGTGGVTVDNATNDGATLKVGGGVSLGNHIVLDNGATLDNAGNITNTVDPYAVESDAGTAMVDNLATGNIAGNDGGVTLFNGGSVTNAGNIGASATGSTGVGIAGATGTVNNTSTGSIAGDYSGVTLFNGGSVTNAGSISASATGSTGVGITGATGTVNNTNGGSIAGDYSGVTLFNGGSVTNAGSISNTDAGVPGYGWGVLATDGPGTVSNTNGGVITGTAVGVRLQRGGIVTNDPGALIQTTGTTNGDCNQTANCAVVVYTGQAGSGGALTMSNAGRIIGNIQMDPNAANVTTLTAGGSITGNLDIGTNKTSRLTLDGANTTPQLYSTAVTGTTTFNGALTKAGSGGWIIDSDLSSVSLTAIAAGTLQVGNAGTAGSIGSGNIVNNGVLVFKQTGNNTFAGVISGSGTLTQSGTGVLTLSGANIYTGGTVISAGTLQGDTTSLQGGITDDAALIFNQNSAGTFAGVVSGSGALSQSGTGVLTLDSNNGGFTGHTHVQAGGLIVGGVGGDGAVLGGNVSVDSGATLGGHGTLGGDVDVASGAHLAPGNSIGTLSIGGNLTVAQGSMLDFEFGAPAAAPGTFSGFGSGDSVQVGGNLTLNGALLNISNAGGFGPGLYNLFTYGGTLTETSGGIGFGTLPAGNYTVQELTASKQINLLNTTGLTLNLWNGNGLANAT